MTKSYEFLKITGKNFKNDQSGKIYIFLSVKFTRIPKNIRTGN